MTSATEAIKTNEFLRRRKLRLQQVREQSKDIAKQIRERAKVESLRHVTDLDAKKQKEYFDRQEKLVKRLEVLYARGVKNVGASHQSASEVTLQDEAPKTDLSKLRGKEATAELKKKRQAKLDEQKRLLDRKLQAREAANEISREKSSVAVNKLSQKPSTSKVSDDSCQKVPSNGEVVEDNNKDNGKDVEETLVKNDMATQWNSEAIPYEWEPTVPALSLPKDDQASIKEGEHPESKSDKSKRPDLFALSEEMPSDLRGRHPDVLKTKDSMRPSMTLISEYLQSRQLRLRETDTAQTSRKHFEEMNSLKQTIQRTRTSNAEGSQFNACHVLDEQVIPMPTWHAERNCEFCSNSTSQQKSSIHSVQCNTVTNSQINRIYRSIRPLRQSDMVPRPVLRSTSPFRRNKWCSQFTTRKCSASTNTSNMLNRKSSVIVYNHNTRDTRDLPCDNKLVVRDSQPEEDAYSQAMKEVTSDLSKDKEHQKKFEDMRNKVAVTKQTVEKEYRDTINFLNSLPKDKSGKVTKTAYMDERLQNIHKENRQHKMQQEYRKIEKECRRHNSCVNKTKSPSRQDDDEDFNSRDFQYSWMPVPESDGNLAIHAIPNTVKQGKSGHSVKFSKVDSYHEYRSRHKHTPPTKEPCSPQNHSNKKRVETVILNRGRENTSQSSDDCSSVSDTSSVENLKLDKKTKVRQDVKLDHNSSDAERIIIYKILDTKSKKHSSKKNKLLSDIAKSLTSIEKGQKSVVEDGNGDPVIKQHNKREKPLNKTVGNTVSFEEINEGVYQLAEEDGDNGTSTYFPKAHAVAGNQMCPCKKLGKDQKTVDVPQWQIGGDHQPTRTPNCNCSTTTSKDEDIATLVETQKGTPSTSTSSFTTAADKTNNAQTDAGYIKLVDEAGQEAGKFFLGAAGFLKDNAYEVVIQLRKRDGAKGEDNIYEQQEQVTSEKINIKVLRPTEVTENNNVESLPSKNHAEVPVNRACPEKHKDLSKSFSEKGSKKEGLARSSQKLVDENINNNQNSNNESVSSSELSDVRLIRSVEVKKDVSDKDTAIETDYTVPLSKSDVTSRPATTTYTQTTNSPIHRPVYIHMSSSTSTAYMSPPEMILPKFFRRDSQSELVLPQCFRHDFDVTEDDTNGGRKTDTIDKPDNYTKDNKKITHAKKTISKAIIKPAACKKNKLQLSTPPNSTRSGVSHCKQYAYSDNSPGRKVSTPCKFLRLDKIKCKCHDYGVRVPSRDYFKKPFHVTCRSSQHSNTLIGKKNIPKTKSKIANQFISKKNSRANLNPVVKGYINKLLALNKEGVKAIEVADQECSTVGTPGSSIINVPHNVDGRKSFTGCKISLEYIKKALWQQILKENLKNNLNNASFHSILHPNCVAKKLRRKPVHKVKSLNISKRLLRNPYTEERKRTKTQSPSTTTDDTNKTFASSIASRSQPRSSPRDFIRSSIYKDNHTINKTDVKKKDLNSERVLKKPTTPHLRKEQPKKRPSSQLSPLKGTTDTSLESEGTKEFRDYYKNKPDIPISMSTQTSQNIDSDFMKVAEDKLQNMEKIADLTEKCTKRLSNLAKVLEEVRKNKSLVYSQISASDSTDSQSDHKSDKVIHRPAPVNSPDIQNRLANKSPEPIPNKENISEAPNEKSEYISFLTDIPKPVPFQLLESHTIKSPPLFSIPVTTSTDTSNTSASEVIKCRPKPPPALSRIHIKHGRDFIVPHELSTVIEVDSPMSVKNKNHSSRNGNEVPSTSNRSSNEDKESSKDIEKNVITPDNQANVNPDLLQRNPDIPYKPKFSSTESSDDSKFQMIDLKHFNEIMLEPFISMHDYAKKYNIEAPDEGSNIEELQKDDVVNDDMSSLHSDGSLPDVIAELLKRNIITEPFKFDTPSNMNSTTFSSESTLSMLALSKARKGKKKSNLVFQNKENIGETSDTLSISSNPDLENAFKKLGMGWASSTLKKTKERLALSSSSNTSSSSLSQFKLKNFNQDIPALVTDSVSSVLLSKMGNGKHSANNSKHVEQQTSLVNSMTVKEFLANELANKITFTNNKSRINDTEEEFVSLFETKMPEGLKQQSLVNRDDQSNDSIRSGANRARTSTPVQLFKSMTYHSTSSSNISNGLFSNADDLSSVKMTSKNHSTSDKDDLTIPNFSLKMKKGSDCSKSD